MSVSFLILTNYEWRSVGVFGAAIACALLGFADDYTKLVKRRSLGLRARTKLAVTIAISLGLWYVATRRGAPAAATCACDFVDYHIDLGPLYPVLIYLVVAGTTSAVNLTDGLDGLAAGCAAIVLLAYIGITFLVGDYDLAMLAGCLVGACIGFLWFNAFPATIFMGDTGSLGLGGAIAGLAVMTKTEVLLILLGGIFVIEALSVVIQVISFQTTRRRVFLMAPIHHHFELKGVVGDEDHPALLDRGLDLRRDRLHDLPPEPRRLSGRGPAGAGPKSASLSTACQRSRRRPLRRPSRRCAAAGGRTCRGSSLGSWPSRPATTCSGTGGFAVSASVALVCRRTCSVPVGMPAAFR